MYHRIQTSRKIIEKSVGSIKIESDKSHEVMLDKSQINGNEEKIINMIHHAFPPDEADVHQLGFFLILYMKIYFK